MTTDQFITLQKTSEGLFKDRGSRFLGFAFPVSTVEEFMERLDELKKKYHDARHHCYAYVLGEEGLEFRANDDGEPSNSAGAPILGQLRSAGLTNAGVVVVRYFGGTKLGVGGLVAAYKTAAAGAINNNRAITVDILRHFVIEYGYESTNIVQRLFSGFEVKLTDQSFGDRCTVRVGVKKGQSGAFTSRLDEYIQAGTEITYEEETE